MQYFSLQKFMYTYYQELKQLRIYSITESEREYLDLTKQYKRHLFSRTIWFYIYIVYF